MKKMVGYKGRVEPYSNDRKWLTTSINLRFDKPIELSTLVDFIHENIESLEEHCKARLMVGGSSSQSEECFQAILAYHGLLEQYLEE